MEAVRTITIADWLLITVTFLGPIAAVQVQKWIERTREKRNRRLFIFQTLMATRAMRAYSNDHVQALNLIEVFFYGRSVKERAVHNSWMEYRDFLEQRSPAGEDAARSHNEKGIDLLVALLETLAASLGYNFNKVQLRRGGYYPQGHANESAARGAIMDNLAKVLQGNQPVPVSVIVPPDALKKQSVIQEGLASILAGEKPLKVKLGP